MCGIALRTAGVCRETETGCSSRPSHPSVPTSDAASSPTPSATMMPSLGVSGCVPSRRSTRTPGNADGVRIAPAQVDPIAGGMGPGGDVQQTHALHPALIRDHDVHPAGVRRRRPAPTGTSLRASSIFPVGSTAGVGAVSAPELGDVHEQHTRHGFDRLDRTCSGKWSDRNRHCRTRAAPAPPACTPACTSERT